MKECKSCNMLEGRKCLNNHEVMAVQTLDEEATKKYGHKVFSVEIMPKGNCHYSEPSDSSKKGKKKGR